MEIHDGVLAYYLLNNTNISESHKQLIRATLPDLRLKIEGTGKKSVC